MSGILMLGEKSCRALLTDGNGDGCFGTAGVDRVWIDLDDDGRFDAVTERFPLGTPLTITTTRGTKVFTIVADPWASSVAAHERDNRLGRLELALNRPWTASSSSSSSATPSIESVSVSLVSETGELVTILDLSKVHDIPVGRYRIASLELRMADQAAKVWSYTFTGGRRATIVIVPDRSKVVHYELLEDLALEATVAARGDARPGEEVNVTPVLKQASGLYLANCRARPKGAYVDEERSAEIVLHGPDGTILDRANSGFL